MNTDREKKRKSLPKIIWLVVALLPCVLLVIGAVGHFSDTVMQSIAYFLNPVVSIFASYRLLSSILENKPLAGLAAFFLGCFFAALNLFVGIFVGCAISGIDHTL